MPTTTARADVVSAIRAVLLARKASSPTLLRQVHTSRPGAFPETPCAYIGGRDESIAFQPGNVRVRKFEGLTVTIVDALPDPMETGDRLDELVDLLVEDFTAAYAQLGADAILQLSRVSDADVVLTGPSGVANYRGSILAFGETWKREGRT